MSEAPRRNHELTITIGADGPFGVEIMLARKTNGSTTMSAYTRTECERYSRVLIEVVTPKTATYYEMQILTTDLPKLAIADIAS